MCIYIYIYIYLVGRGKYPDIDLSFPRITSSIIGNYKKKKVKLVFSLCFLKLGTLCLSFPQDSKESFVGPEQ